MASNATPSKTAQSISIPPYAFAASVAFEGSKRSSCKKTSMDVINPEEGRGRTVGAKVDGVGMGVGTGVGAAEGVGAEVDTSDGAGVGAGEVGLCAPFAGVDVSIVGVDVSIVGVDVSSGDPSDCAWPSESTVDGPNGTFGSRGVMEPGEDIPSSARGGNGWSGTVSPVASGESGKTNKPLRRPPASQE